MPASRRPSGRPSRAEIRVGELARLDHGRMLRTGAPEVVLGEGKSPPHLVAIVRELRARGVGALVSRPTERQRRALDHAFADAPDALETLADGRLLRVVGPLGRAAAPGPIALVTAGTADIPLAEEARGVLNAVGVDTPVEFDVGVAGLHRLVGAVRRLERRRPIAYIAFAGREGALPTVLAGLVAAPVLAVPTSVGYGRGGGGRAALGAMLQSCAPLAVFNVDAAVPAALFALQLLAGASRAQ